MGVNFALPETYLHILSVKMQSVNQGNRPCGDLPVTANRPKYNDITRFMDSFYEQVH